MSDLEASAPEGDDGVEGAVEFGWEEPESKVSGRRKKTQKKAKLGTFGAFRTVVKVCVTVCRSLWRSLFPCRCHGAIASCVERSS